MDTPTDDSNQDDPAAVPPVPPIPSALPDPPVPPTGETPRITFGADGVASAQPPAPPKPPLWQRVPRRLVIIGGVIAVIAIIGWWSGRGKTDAQDLAVGDCFEQPSGLDDIQDVVNQSCEELHETEIFAVVTLTAADAYPGEFSLLGPNAADLACVDAIERLDIIFANVPDDTTDGYFFAAREDWDRGDRDVLCYATSVSGFPGPLINR